MADEQQMAGRKDDMPPRKEKQDVKAPSPDDSENLKEKGNVGNIRQNTTHQGYQQDR